MTPQNPAARARVAAAIDALLKTNTDWVSGASELHAALEAAVHPMPAALAAIDQMAAAVRHFDQILSGLRRHFVGDDGMPHD